MVPISQEALDKLRQAYPPGCTVELVEMDDPYRDMPPGIRGVVAYVDDNGSVHVDWSNGSTLAVLYGIDRIRRIE